MAIGTPLAFRPCLLKSCLLVVCASAACTSSSLPANPPLGEGNLSRNGNALPITAAWAELDYAYFDTQNDSYGVYYVTFTTDAAAAGAHCLSRNTLDFTFELELDTTQVYHDAPGPQAQLPVGDIPVMSSAFVPNNSSPTQLMATCCGNGIDLTSGKVTIASFDDSQISGTLNASSPSDNVSFTGVFNVPICKN